MKDQMKDQQPKQWIVTILKLFQKIWRQDPILATMIALDLLAAFVVLVVLLVSLFLW